MIKIALAISGLVICAAGSMMPKRVHSNTIGNRTSRQLFPLGRGGAKGMEHHKASSCCRKTVKMSSSSSGAKPGKSFAQTDDSRRLTTQSGVTGRFHRTERKDTAIGVYSPITSTVRTSKTKANDDARGREKKVMAYKNNHEIGEMKNYNRDNDLTRPMERIAAEVSNPIGNVFKIVLVGHTGRVEEKRGT